MTVPFSIIDYTGWPLSASSLCQQEAIVGLTTNPASSSSFQSLSIFWARCVCVLSCWCKVLVTFFKTHTPSRSEAVRTEMGFSPSFLSSNLCLGFCLTFQFDLTFLLYCLPWGVQCLVLNAKTTVLQTLFHQLHGWARSNPCDIFLIIYRFTIPSASVSLFEHLLIHTLSSEWKDHELWTREIDVNANPALATCF